MQYAIRELRLTTKRWIVRLQDGLTNKKRGEK